MIFFYLAVLVTLGAALSIAHLSHWPRGPERVERRACALYLRDVIAEDAAITHASSPTRSTLSSAGRDKG